MFFKKTFQTRTCIILATLLFLPYFFNVFYKGGIGLLNHLVFFLGIGLSGITFYVALFKKIYAERELPFYENFFLITLVAAFSISYLASATKNIGLLELGGIYAGAILIILGYHIAKEKDRLNNLFSFLSFSSLLSIIVGFSVYFGGTFERFAGTFNNFFEPWSAFPNAFGDFLLLTLPLTFYLAERKKKNAGNIFSFLPELTFVLGVSAIFLTDSQGVHLAGIALFLLMLTRLVLTGNFAKKLILLTLIGLILGYGALGWKTSITANYRENVEIAGQVVDGKNFEQKNSVNTRIEHFKTAASLIASAPLFGYGPGSYPYISANKLSLLNSADHPHNFFLKVGVENGVVTLITLFGLIGVILLRAFLIFFQKLDPAREAVFLSIVAFLAHQMIDYNLNFASVEFLFFILLGTLIIERIRKSKRLHIKELRFINHFMLIVFGAFLILFSLNDGINNALMAKAQTEKDYHTYQQRNFLKRSFFEDYAMFLKSAGEPLHSVIEKGLALNPYNAELYALAGNFQKAYDLNPHNLNYLLGLYENASAARKEVLKEQIKPVLEKYAFLLSVNTSFTILTENPINALSLARLINDPELASRIEQTILEEQAKFGTLYNLKF